MILTPITALISSDVSPALIANVIEHAGVFCEDRFGNVSFHHADSPMAQGILEGLELIMAADRAGDQHAAASADEENAYWEIFHSGWPSDGIPDFKAHKAAMDKQLKVSRRDKGTTGLLMIMEALLMFIEHGARAGIGPMNLGVRAIGRRLPRASGDRPSSRIVLRPLSPVFAKKAVAAIQLELSQHYRGADFYR